MSINKIIKTLLFLYLILKPFYFWGSGLPQIADFLLVLLILLAMFYVKLPKYEPVTNGNFGLVSLLFVFYVFVVNCVWYIALGNESSLLFNNLFYVFNVLSMLAVIFLYNSGLFNGIFKVIYYGIVTSIGLQCFIYIAMGDINPGRAVNFFNNPNQLAYYALLCLASLLIIERKVKYRTFTFIFTVVGCFFLIFVTLSKGALAGAIFLFVAHVIISKRKGLYRLISLSLSTILSLFLYLVSINSSFLYNKNRILDGLLLRLERANLSGQEFLTYRAYDRIINHPEYWILGAGEGAYTRFNSIANYEIHSTLGTVFFSYGIVGFSLFMLMLGYIFYKNKLIYAYPVIAMMIYGLTHNGIRNSMLWIMFALLIIASTKTVEKIKKVKEEKVA